jgi:hypothetical protein
LTSIILRAVEGAFQQLRTNGLSGVVDDDACVGCLFRGRLDVLVIGDVQEQRLQSRLVEFLGLANPRVDPGGTAVRQGAGERQSDHPLPRLPERLTHYLRTSAPVPAVHPAVSPFAAGQAFSTGYASDRSPKPGRSFVPPDELLPPDFLPAAFD